MKHKTITLGLTLLLVSWSLALPWRKRIQVSNCPGGRWMAVGATAMVQATAYPVRSGSQTPANSFPVEITFCKVASGLVQVEAVCSMIFTCHWSCASQFNR